MISAVWFASIDRKVIIFGDFTSSVTIEHSHSFAAETHKVLAIMTTVDQLLIKLPNSSTSITIVVG